VSAGPEEATMMESLSTAVQRKAFTALAILALACRPCGASPFGARGARAKRRRAVPTDSARVRLTIFPFPRSRRPERDDGVHERADSQRGVVTRYVGSPNQGYDPRPRCRRGVSDSSRSLDRVSRHSTPSISFSSLSDLLNPPWDRDDVWKRRGELTNRCRGELGELVSRYWIRIRRKLPAA